MKECLFKYVTETAVLHNYMSCFEDGCTRCTLSDETHKPIIFRGNPKADILLLGEAPGKVEQERGTPFVGPAGELLDRIMSAIELDTNTDMVLTNSVFCRPTAPAYSGKQNYTPQQEQLTVCSPLVHAFIQNIARPKVIIACGRTALQTITGISDIKMYEYEGQWTEYHCKNILCNGKDYYVEREIRIPVFVMTHPAAILHMAKDPTAQTKKKKKVWEYMKIFRDTWKEKIK